MNSIGRSLLLFGKCVTSDLHSAVKVSILHYELDERLLMYFQEKYLYYADDPKGECKPGDFVIIKECPGKTKQITHVVDKLVYKMGNFIDPLTGKKCAAKEYIEDIERTSALFNRKPPFLASPPEVNSNEKNPS